jgi:nucleotide-binding universal stress UspA family protein
MRVLVALDAGPQCEKLIAAVEGRPWPANTSFTLVHVLEPFPFRKITRCLDADRDEIEIRLKKFGERFRTHGWTAEERVLFGRPWRQITKLAAFCETDLIVIGSQGAGGVAAHFVGSTAGSVLRHAPCSVEVVRLREGLEERENAEWNVLVATDGSECSKVALQAVSRRAWPAWSNFRVVSIPHPSMPLSSFRESELKDVTAIKHAKEYAESGAEILRAAGLRAESSVLLPFHSDGREIVGEAERWPAQLIVMGSHGRRGFNRVRLGSVSEYVVVHAPCSVEVIRPSSEEHEVRSLTRSGDDGKRFVAAS